MPSNRATLTATPRTEFGTRSSRRLRRDGKIPGVVYSDGQEAVSFQVENRDARVILIEGHALFDLQIEGSDAVPVVIKEQQHHPVRGDLEHLDLQQVDLAQAILAEVPLELAGEEIAPGVKQGGVLEHVTRLVTVEALPTDIPDLLTLDVSAMEILDVLSLEDLTAPQGVTLVSEDPSEVTLATLNPPRVEEEPETDLEVEPEVVGEGEAGADEAAEEGEAGEDSSDEE